MNSVHAVSNGSDFAKDLRFIFFFCWDYDTPKRSLSSLNY